MPVFRFADMKGEYETRKYSKASGPLLTGSQIEVGWRLRVTMDGQSSDLGCKGLVDAPGRRA